MVRPHDNPEWLNVKLRYKTPGSERSILLEKPFVGDHRPLREADTDFRFAASVVMSAMWLRGDQVAPLCHPWKAAEHAAAALGDDQDGKRREFVRLMRQLKQEAPGRQARR